MPEPVSDTTLRDRIAGKLANVLCSASNYPKAVGTHILGHDMRPLLDKTADVVMALLVERDRKVKAEAIEEAAVDAEDVLYLSITPSGTPVLCDAEKLGDRSTRVEEWLRNRAAAYRIETKEEQK